MALQRTVLFVIYCYIGNVFALQGPGGMECNTPRECQLLAKKMKAISQQKRKEETAEGNEERGEKQQPFDLPVIGKEQIHNMRGHRGEKRKSVTGPSRTARFACAVVLVSGPTGLRFSSDGHVDRFKENAKGCVVYVSAAPHYKRRAADLAGGGEASTTNVFVRRFEEIVRRGTDGVPLEHQPPQWLARVAHVIRAMRSPRWEDFELVVLTHSDMEPVQPYGAALSEVRARPHSLFLMGEGLVYSGGAAFHRAFQHAGTWDDVPTNQALILVPAPDNLSPKLAAAAMATTSTFCAEFVRTSKLLRHVCEPDLSGDMTEESAAGKCICSGALGPARLNLDVNDLWWHEVHWVFSFSPAANGGLLTHGLDDPDLYINDPVLNTMKPMKATICSSSLAFIGRDTETHIGKKGNPMTGAKSTVKGLADLARTARKEDPVLRLDGLLFDHFSAPQSRRRRLLQEDPFKTHGYSSVGNSSVEEDYLTHWAELAKSRRKLQTARGGGDMGAAEDFLSQINEHFSEEAEGARQEWGAHKSNHGNIHSGTASSLGESAAAFGFGDESVNSLGVAKNLKIGKSAASSVKRPESNEIDKYIHGKMLSAYANHIQETCSKPPAVPQGSLPLLFLDFGPHIHVGLFPALIRVLGARRVSFVNFQPRRSFAAWTYYDDTDAHGQRNIPCSANYHNAKKSGVRLLCPVWHGSALFDEVPLGAAKWSRLNPYQRCLWLVDELTWRFHTFLSEHPKVKRSQVMDVFLDETAKVAKADVEAMGMLTLHMRQTAVRASFGAPTIASSTKPLPFPETEGLGSSTDLPSGADPSGAARVDLDPESPEATVIRRRHASEAGRNGKDPLKYQVKFDDIPDIESREQTRARFLKAEQWGLKAWNDEYFNLLDFPPHVLRVIAPDRLKGGDKDEKKTAPPKRMVIRKSPPKVASRQRPQREKPVLKSPTPHPTAASANHHRDDVGRSVSKPQGGTHLAAWQVHHREGNEKTRVHETHRDVYNDDVERHSGWGLLQLMKLLVGVLLAFIVCFDLANRIVFGNRLLPMIAGYCARTCSGLAEQ